MSKASYTRNHHIYWNVLISYEEQGKVVKYLYKGHNPSYTESIEEAKRVASPWAKLPSFKAEVVGIRFE